MFIDLSLPIQPHWRYGFQRKEVSSFDAGDAWQITEFVMRTHWFSHIDFPRHTGKDYPNSEAFPLEHYNGKASILHIDKGPMAMYAITAEDLEEAKHGRILHDILLIRTDWPTETSWETPQFWDDAPFLTDEAIYWIKEQKPNTVAFDFPQDYSIRLLKDRKVTPEEQKTHTILLRNNILLVEYIHNLDQIHGEECEFFCLPLNIRETDGCPVRAVARIK